MPSTFSSSSSSSSGSRDGRSILLMNVNSGMRRARQIANSFLRLRLDAARRVDQHDRAVGGEQRAVGVLAEVLVARRVEQVDRVAAVRELQDRRGDRDPALALELHPVGGRRARAAARRNLTGRHDRSAVQQKLFGERRLAGVGVRDDRERPPLGDFRAEIHDPTPFDARAPRLRRAPARLSAGGTRALRCGRRGRRRASGRPSHRRDGRRAARASDRFRDRSKRRGRARATVQFPLCSVVPGRMRSRAGGTWNVKRSDGPSIEESCSKQPGSALSTQPPWPVKFGCGFGDEARRSGRGAAAAGGRSSPRRQLPAVGGQPVGDQRAAGRDDDQRRDQVVAPHVALNYAAGSSAPANGAASCRRARPIRASAIP